MRLTCAVPYFAIFGQQAFDDRRAGVVGVDQYRKFVVGHDGLLSGKGMTGMVARCGPATTLFIRLRSTCTGQPREGVQSEAPAGAGA